MKKTKVINYKVAVACIAGMLSLASCYDREQKASPETTTSSQGVEYAPQMYHAEPYEPLTQVVDKEAGLNHWPFEKVGGGVSDYDSLGEGHGEWYNSNYYNEFGMNMRMPVKGTIAKGKNVYKYNINPDSASAWTSLASPIEGDAKAIEEGQVLYSRYCQHCHGENGDGKGPVGEIYGGVPNYHSKGYRIKTRGDIYHTISYGRGAMRAHGAQVDPEERWKIAEYIKAWQAKVELEEQGN
jgi:mono/diheme cytochrome c family protein